jgi:hypothetical protein
MADERRYRVITIQPGVVSADSPALYQDLGEHAGHDSDAAVEAALAANGKIPQGVERCVGIPVGNWNECEVGEVSQPKFKSKKADAALPPWRPKAPTTQPTSPDPDDAT